MGGFNQALFQRLRDQRLFENNPEELTPQMLSFDASQATTPSVFQRQEDRMPATSAYAEALQQQPKLSEYEQNLSGKRKFWSGLAGAFTGAFRGPEEGARVAQGFRYGPYMSQMRSYAADLAPKEQAASIEQTRYKQQVDEMLKRAQAYRYGTQAQSDLARSENYGAQAAEHRFNVSPSGLKAQWDRSTAARPTTSDGYMFTPQYGGGTTETKFGPNKLEVAQTVQGAQDKRSEADRQLRQKLASDQDALRRWQTKTEESGRNSRFAVGQANIDRRSKEREASIDRRLSERLGVKATSQSEIHKAMSQTMMMLGQLNPRFNQFMEDPANGKIAEWNEHWYTSDNSVKEHQEFIRQLVKGTADRLGISDTRKLLPELGLTPAAIGEQDTGEL